MAVYQNRLITIIYREDTGILTVTWSNSKPYDLAEVQESIKKVIDTIKEYQCRKLLIDASVADVSMDDGVFKAILTQFVSELNQSGIQKLARIITSDQKREEQIQNIRNKLGVSYEFYDISNREQALKWLIDSDNKG